MALMKVGIVGARGYVGRELLRVLARHTQVEVSFVCSRSHAGNLVGQGDLRFEDLGPDEVAARDADAVILALQNGQAEPFVAALDRAQAKTAVIDVSADYRFDAAWAYGLPELFRGDLRGARRIANPGCYATAVALAVAPVAELLSGAAHAFGISGYSGAGVTPSPRNDPERLRDNVLPYSLVEHLHEREVSFRVGPVRLLPHVAPFFRGITATVSLPLKERASAADLWALYERRYAGEPLVRLAALGEEAPLVRDAADKPWATIGGLVVHPSRPEAVVVATLDNLLKGAASQAVQNLNLALGLPERAGIEPWES